MSQRQLRFAGLALGLVVLSACKDDGDEPPPSNPVEERTVVTLQSYVYASADDSSFKIAERVRDQIKSAFGALKGLRVTGSNREVSNALGELLYKEPLVLVRPQGGESVVFRVWYRYADEVFAPAAAPRGVPLLVGGIHRQDETLFAKMVAACTPNTAREREYRGRLQSVFDGSLPSCQEAILAEQSVIEAARVRLEAPEEEVVPEEFDRVYLPVVARLHARKASQMGRYPRYEEVLPQSGRVAVAQPAGGFPAAGSAAATSPDGSYDDVDTPQGERPAPIIVPGGAEPAGQRGPQNTEEAGDPDLSPKSQPVVPGVVVVPGGAKPAGGPVQPRRDDGDGPFNWEDLGDKKFWVLWLAVFALYPLLRRRPSDG